MCFNFCDFFSNTRQGRFRAPKRFVGYPLTPTYKLYPEDTLEVDYVPLGRLILKLSMFFAGTENSEHIQTIMTYTQEADNVIQDQLHLLVNSYAAP